MQRPLNWWISIFLVLAALRGLILGVSGLVVPAVIPVPFELTPLNARFVAALYFAGSIGLLLTLFARKSRDARPCLFGVGTVTGLLLAVTLLRWSDISGASRPGRRRCFGSLCCWWAPERSAMRCSARCGCPTEILRFLIWIGAPPPARRAGGEPAGLTLPGTAGTLPYKIEN